MTTLIYAKLPFEKINYLEREEFHTVEEQFKSRLLESIKKNGIIDPLYAEVGHHYGRYIKIIVGNNRMAVANILKIKRITHVQDNNIINCRFFAGGLYL